MQALWIWRQFPKQIASDLSEFHHRRIAEWHDGSMSSYELLELLEYMREEGAFKTALRDGEFCERDLVWRLAATEAARLRSIMQTVHGGKDTDIRTFPTMAEIRESMQDEEEFQDRREDFYAFATRSPREIEE